MAKKQGATWENGMLLETYKNSVLENEVYSKLDGELKKSCQKKRNSFFWYTSHIVFKGGQNLGQNEV